MTTHQVLASIPDATPCCVTIDIDVLDPAVAPGTGVPLPGGMALHELEELLETIGREREVVGFDVVEFDPTRDVRNTTKLAVMSLILRFLDAIHQRRQGLISGG